MREFPCNYALLANSLLRGCLLDLFQLLVGKLLSTVERLARPERSPSERADNASVEINMSLLYNNYRIVEDFEYLDALFVRRHSNRSRSLTREALSRCRKHRDRPYHFTL